MWSCHFVTEEENELNEESLTQLLVRMLILRHCEVYLLKSCLWGPPVALWVTPALHPRRARTCEQSHANSLLTHSLEMSKHIFSPFYPRGVNSLNSQPRPILYASAFYQSLASYLDSLSSMLLEENWMLLPEVYKEDMRTDKLPLHLDWCK